MHILYTRYDKCIDFDVVTIAYSVFAFTCIFGGLRLGGLPGAGRCRLRDLRQGPRGDHLSNNTTCLTHV